MGKSNQKKSIIFVMLYMAFNIFIFLTYTNMLSIYLCWNLILGILPLVFISLAKKASSNKKPIIIVILLILLWLFFLPNSIYMVTDYIHLQDLEFYEQVKLNEFDYDFSRSYTTEYKMQISTWLDLISITIGFILSTYFGIKSLDVFLNMVNEKLNDGLTILTLLLVSFLSGIGIYIGRFLRFNSWDIINPLRIINLLIKSLNSFSYKFISLFTIYIVFIYLLYKFVVEEDDQNCQGCNH